uniref:Uncharacterized protein n=1 Tax=Setaria italica TaxID=4555 RepID=K3Y3Z2_SETIT
MSQRGSIGSTAYMMIEAASRGHGGTICDRWRTDGPKGEQHTTFLLGFAFFSCR